MTTPRPTSVTTTLTSEIIPPGASSDFRLFIIGQGKATSTAPTHYTHDVESLESLLNSGSDLYTAVEDFHSQVDCLIAISTTTGTGHQDYIDILKQARQLDDRPHVIYVPAEICHEGTQIGTFKTTITDTATNIETTGAHKALKKDALLTADGEIIKVTADVSQGTDPIPVTRGAEGTTARSHASGNTLTDMHNPVAAALEEMCEELSSRGAIDSPRTSVDFDVQWGHAGNPSRRVMAFHNYVNSDPPTPFILGGWIRETIYHGFAIGLSRAQIIGVASLEYALSHSHRAGTTTEVSRLVGSFNTTIVRDRGRYSVQGDEFQGYGEDITPERYWHSGITIDKVQELAEKAADDYIGFRNTLDVIDAAAAHVEAALSPMVALKELSELSVTPNIEANTPAARARGEAYLAVEVAVPGIIKHVVLQIALSLV